MEEVEVPQSSFFVGNGYLQPAGCGWHGHHGLRYHTYLMSTRRDLKNAVAFAYGESFSTQKQAVTGIEKRSSSRCRRYRTNGEIRPCRWRESRRFWRITDSICRGFWLEDICFCHPLRLICSLRISKIWCEINFMPSFPHFESRPDSSQLLLTPILLITKAKTSNLADYVAWRLSYY